MSWLKIDDEFEDNAKVEPLSDAAHRLWMRAACWCRKPANAHTNGFVPRAMLVTIAKRSAPLKKLEKLAEELVNSKAGGTKERGLWIECEGGWRFHDWHEYQPDDEEVRRLAEIRSEAGRKGAQARWQRDAVPCDLPLADACEDQCDLDGNSMAENAPTPIPIPVPNKPPSDFQLDPDQPDRSRSPGARAKGAGRKPRGHGVLTPIPEPFPLLERHLEYGRSKNWPDWWVENRHERFVDLAKAKGWRYADWNLALYTHLRSELDYGRGPAQLQHLAPRGAATTPPAAAQEAQQNLLSLEARARQQNARKPRQLGSGAPANANFGTRSTDAPDSVPPPPATEEAS